MHNLSTEPDGLTRTSAKLPISDPLLLGQKRILELVGTGAPLAATLDELILFIEAQEPGMRCSLLIVSDDGLHLCRGRSPNLPAYLQALHRAIDGAPITPPYHWRVLAGRPPGQRRAHPECRHRVPLCARHGAICCFHSAIWPAAQPPCEGRTGVCSRPSPCTTIIRAIRHLRSQIS